MFQPDSRRAYIRYRPEFVTLWKNTLVSLFIYLFIYQHLTPKEASKNDKKKKCKTTTQIQIHKPQPPNPVEHKVM